MGRLASGPYLMGQIGSGVLNVLFHPLGQKVSLVSMADQLNM